MSLHSLLPPPSLFLYLKLSLYLHYNNSLRYILDFDKLSDASKAIIPEHFKGRWRFYQRNVLKTAKQMQQANCVPWARRNARWRQVLFIGKFAGRSLIRASSTDAMLSWSSLLNVIAPTHTEVDSVCRLSELLSVTLWKNQQFQLATDT